MKKQRGDSCDLSILVVSYAMDRELPRTLFSLTPPYQRGISALNYEIVVLDNGSPKPLDLSLLPDEVLERVRLVRFNDASPSPVAAINKGLEMVYGNVVGLMIDGARIASPGLLQKAVQAMRLHERPVVATIGFHLGPDIQMRSMQNGYNERVEDQLLEGADWKTDGYNLFNIASLAGSSAGGWFQPIAESNALFMPKEMWHELGGLDERFMSPGGGAVNLDTYVRACELPDIELILLFGEATFHQIHGGVATNARSPDVIRNIFDEYESIRGKKFSLPTKAPIYFGQAPIQCAPWIFRSVRQLVGDQGIN